MGEKESGICVLKQEYILTECDRKPVINCISEKDKDLLSSATDEIGSPCKKQKISKHGKKKLRGQNKARGPTYVRNCKLELCNKFIDSNATNYGQCEKKNCEFMHDIVEYLKLKPKDIGETCYSYSTTGKCTRGLSCRFGSQHITSDGKNIIDTEKLKCYEAEGLQTKNQMKHDVQVALRKRQYDFRISEGFVKSNQENNKNNKDDAPKEEKTSGAITDEDLVKLRAREKKVIAWKDKLFLSPLTTVGNLPFRRICKEFGADITCSEMAMCTSILQGLPQEWALLKRHRSEDLFGVQLCGNNPYLLTKCGQLLEQETEIDFIDINVGCPIELVVKTGGGSGLLRRTRVLESCVRNLSEVVSFPVSVKTRTGIYNNDPIAHKLAPNFKSWGASLLTIHGRSKEQRFTKSADWKYIREVAQAAAPLPVFGNGDILSYADYSAARELSPELAGVMIGRGALIKPWIFTEIKERKLWDISSSERFDILKKYRDYGLEHWGSDNKGVENVRRFMLEWLSFLYRYVPVGLLERPPQKINERPPFYKGRDELETLMASPSAADWIKISEMLLGPIPENFTFLPKHKANAYQ